MGRHFSVILRDLHQIFVVYTLISAVITDGKYSNSHASPLLPSNYRNTSRHNATGLSRFSYVQPVTRKSPLRISAHTPDYFHYHYMQNLRRQHEKPEEEEVVSALRGPTRHQILGKPGSDVELSILEDLQRQTKNFTLDDVKPVMEPVVMTTTKAPVRSAARSRSSRKGVEASVKEVPKKEDTQKSPTKEKPTKKKVKESTQVKKSYKESFEATRPGSDKNGKRRTIKTQRTMTYATTMKPVQLSKSKKRSREYSRSKSSTYDSDKDDNYDDDDDSVETSDTKKVFTTMSKRSKSVNPHLYEAPNDHYDPIRVDQDRDMYSMEWNDRYNVKDFVLRRDGNSYEPERESRERGKGRGPPPRGMGRPPKQDRQKKKKAKPRPKKTKRESGEVPMLDIYGGGTFDPYQDDPRDAQGDDYYYDNNDYKDRDYDYYEDNGDGDVVNKNYQDIYTKHYYPYAYEYGHLVETPYGWEERFQDTDYRNNRHKGKVIWSNDDGDFGQHYWDLNP